MKKNNSINGFIVRRPEKKVDQFKSDNHSKKNIDKEKTFDFSKADDRAIGKPRLGHDIDYFGNPIEDFDIPVKKEKPRRKYNNRVRKSPIKIFFKVVKWIFILMLVLGLSYGIYAAYKFVSAGNNIFQGNLMDIFNKQELKVDSNGRSNILVLGTSEDDPGHEGAMLTDSMLVISVSPASKDAFMFSIPRDLYVNFEMACNSGYRGKINEYFMCANDGETAEDEQDRLSKMQDFVGEIFGLDIQYGVRVNHTVIKEAVDAVGGVDVDVQGSGGAPGVLDRHADWRCNFSCYYVKYDNGVHHMDGEHALYFAAARGSSEPTYGLARSNFDREVNQQKVIIALKDKALSTGTLTNLGAISGLFEALGNNLSTNIEAGEIGTFAQVASEVDTNNITRISLADSGNSVVTTGYVGDASVVMPSIGLYNYTQIQKLIAKYASNNLVEKEAAPVVVLNGTDQAGLAQTESDKLSALGFIISSIGNAPDKNVATEIYQIGDDNTATAAKLSEIYKVTIKKSLPPFTINGDDRFVVVLGQTTDGDQ